MFSGWTYFLKGHRWKANGIFHIIIYLEPNGDPVPLVRLSFSLPWLRTALARAFLQLWSLECWNTLTLSRDSYCSISSHGRKMLIMSPLCLDLTGKTRGRGWNWSASSSSPWLLPPDLLIWRGGDEEGECGREEGEGTAGPRSVLGCFCLRNHRAQAEPHQALFKPGWSPALRGHES